MTQSSIPFAIGGHPGDSSGTAWRDVVSLGGEFTPAFVCSAYGPDAAFIVRACNSHADLLAALKSAAMALDLAGLIPGDDYWQQQGRAAARTSRAAIAKAEQP